MWRKAVTKSMALTAEERICEQKGRGGLQGVLERGAKEQTFVIMSPGLSRERVVFLTIDTNMQSTLYPYGCHRAHPIPSLCSHFMLANNLLIIIWLSM